MGGVADGIQSRRASLFGAAKHPDHDPLGGMSQVGPYLHCATDRAAGNVGNHIGHRRANLARIFDGCGQNLSHGIHRRLDDVSRAFDCGNDLVFCCLNHS